MGPKAGGRSQNGTGLHSAEKACYTGPQAARRLKKEARKTSLSQIGQYGASQCGPASDGPTQCLSARRIETSAGRIALRSTMRPTQCTPASAASPALPRTAACRLRRTGSPRRACPCGTAPPQIHPPHQNSRTHNAHHRPCPTRQNTVGGRGAARPAPSAKKSGWQRFHGMGASAPPAHTRCPRAARPPPPPTHIPTAHPPRSADFRPPWPRSWGLGLPSYTARACGCALSRCQIGSRGRRSAGAACRSAARRTAWGCSPSPRPESPGYRPRWCPQTTRCSSGSASRSSPTEADHKNWQDALGSVRSTEDSWRRLSAVCATSMPNGALGSGIGAKPRASVRAGCSIRNARRSDMYCFCSWSLMRKAATKGARGCGSGPGHGRLVVRSGNAAQGSAPSRAWYFCTSRSDAMAAGMFAKGTALGAGGRHRGTTAGPVPPGEDDDAGYVRDAPHRVS